MKYLLICIFFSACFPAIPFLNADGGTDADNYCELFCCVGNVCGRANTEICEPKDAGIIIYFCA